METYEVVVVGAGPAGSTLAYRLAKAGVKTLLLEQRKMPRVKPCGGGLDGVFFQHLPPGIDIEPLVEDWTHKVVLSFQNQSQGIWDLPRPLALTQRFKLDHHLAQAAAEAGADLHEEERPEQVGPPKFVGTERPGPRTVYFSMVTTDRDRYYARVVVGADGAYSWVASKCEFHTPRDVFVASEWDVQDLMSRESWAGNIILDLSVKPLGYWWGFPKGDHVNTGFGLPKRFAPGINQTVASFNKRWGVDGEYTRKAHWIPFARPGYQAVKNNVLLVGDAAGVVDVATGAGIGPGVESSARAAVAILDHLDHGMPLGLYQGMYDRMLAEQQAGLALRNMLILSLMTRRRVLDSAVLAVLAKMSGIKTYRDWAEAHPVQYRAGRAMQKLVVNRMVG